MKYFLISILILFFSTAAFLRAQQSELPIVPRPVKMITNTGNFYFTNNTQIIIGTNADLLPLTDLLKEAVKSKTGLELKITENKSPGYKSVRFVFDSSIASKEGYKLNITPDSLIVAAKEEAGLFYGLQSLFQLFQAASDKYLAIPCAEIEDYPRFEWRGMHLDVCRHFFPVEFIKKYLDILAMYKINTFHFHLTDDQGWRIEIKKYPGLTDIGSRRKETMGDGTGYGGYYTQDEIKEIVEHAQRNHINVLPEIEMPGHALAALAAYPQYSCTGGPFEVGTIWGVYEDVFCAGKDSTFLFLQNILDEVIKLFPYEYIHIGGDEVPKARWESCSLCQKRIHDENLKNEHELQSYFIQRIEKYLNARGKKIIGWDEILEGGLAPNAAVMSWRGTEGGIAAAKMNHRAVMSPNSFCYFDYYQGLSGEPKGIGGFVPIEKVYNYEPVPEVLSAAESRYIIGAQANLWTEYIPTTEHVEYMLLPRLLALSEILWTPKGERDYNNFTGRLSEHYEILADRNINFRIPPPSSEDGIKLVSKEGLIELSKPIKNSKILYTTNNDEPDINSAEYSSPLKVKDGDILKAKTFLNNGRTSRTSTIQICAIDTAVNGLHYNYYEGSWTSIPNFESMQPVKSGKIYKVSLSELKHREDEFALDINGFIEIDEAGEYIFYLTSDDGSRISIDNKTAVENDGMHSSIEKSGKIFLDKGIHPINISYFEKGGGNELKCEYEGPDFTRRFLPANKLFISK